MRSGIEKKKKCDTFYNNNELTVKQHINTGVPSNGQTVQQARKKSTPQTLSSARERKNQRSDQERKEEISVFFHQLPVAGKR